MVGSKTKYFVGYSVRNERHRTDAVTVAGVKRGMVVDRLGGIAKNYDLSRNLLYALSPRVPCEFSEPFRRRSSAVPSPV